MTGTERSDTIAHQSVQQMGARASILAKQRADHARLDQLMDRARQAASSSPGREDAGRLRGPGNDRGIPRAARWNNQHSDQCSGPLRDDGFLF
jgi:hypothetical protein